MAGFATTGCEQRVAVPAVEEQHQGEADHHHARRRHQPRRHRNEARTVRHAHRANMPDQPVGGRNGQAEQDEETEDWTGFLSEGAMWGYIGALVALVTVRLRGDGRVRVVAVSGPVDEPDVLILVHTNDVNGTLGLQEFVHFTGRISDEEVASVNASLVRSLAQLQVRRRRRV
jgi:hypothetical protein